LPTLHAHGEGGSDARGACRKGIRSLFKENRPELVATLRAIRNL
jgi:hypothetical protein